MHTLKQLQQALQKEVVAAKVAKFSLLTAIGEGTKLNAQRMIGHYQTDWPSSKYGPMGKLAPSTLAIKRRLGLGLGGNPDTPLYATGKYREDINFQVFLPISTVCIGSNTEYAKFLEYGTTKMSPRPIFLKSLMLTLPLTDKLIPKLYFQHLKR